MYIAIGSMMHESNTFSSVSTDIEAFRRTQYFFGEDLVKYHVGKTTELGGMLEVFNKNGVSILPTISAVAMPSGVVARKAYGEIKDKMVERIQNDVDKLDGVLLALHGAMVVEDMEDPEGDLLGEIRKILPSGVPLAATLDMHATLSETMVENSDFFIAYRTHPHLDQFNVGLRAAKLMLRIISDKSRLSKAFIKIPMIIPGETNDEPRNKLVAELERIETDARVLTSSFFIGYPWADTSIAGDSVLVVTDGDQNLAQRYAQGLAAEYWSLRGNFPLRLHSVDEAIRISMDPSGWPTVLCEMGDNLFGGASGDVVTTVRYLVESGINGVVVAALVDPAAVRQAIETGVGATIRMEIGGKLYKTDNPPLLFRGKVKVVSKNVVGYDPMLAGYETAMGETVLLEGDGIEIIVVERPGKLGGPTLLEELGVDPRKRRLIVWKDSLGPLISYRGIAKNVLLVDTPGWCKQQLLSADYHNVPRPIFPFDPNLSWSVKNDNITR